MPFIRSVSGLRATLGDSLTPSLVAAYTAAFSSMLDDGPIVVGRDGRPSGLWMEDIVVGTLRSCGRTVERLGMVPTPTVQLLVEHGTAVGGISITASHNPAPWNGLKFLDATGVFLDAQANARLWEIVDGSLSAYSAVQQAGHVINVTDAVERHLRAVLPQTSTSVRSSRRLRVVVDAVNASASFIVPEALRRLGLDVVELHCTGSGIFPHVPEPITENLTGLAEAVLRESADIGVAVDPDGDRLVLFDEHGTPIGEELTIALAVRSVLSSGRVGPVVINYSTTRTVEDIAAMYGCVTHRTPVGEINVVRRMQETNAVIGGEGSGGVIDPTVHYGRDAIVGVARIVDLLLREQTSLSEMVRTLPSYSMQKTKFDIPVNFDLLSLHGELVSRYPDAHITTDDGIRISWNDRWVQCRTSNTEPIVRIIAEAPSRPLAEELITQIRSVAGV